MARADDPSDNGLSRAITNLGRARSLEDLSARLCALLKPNFGAPIAVLVLQESRLRQEALPSSANGSGVAIIPATAELEDKLRAGKTLLIHRGDKLLASVGAPAETAVVIVLPCMGEGSNSALCVGWSKQRRTVDGEVVRKLELISTMVGLALERIGTNRKYRRLTASLDHRVRNVLAQMRSIGVRSAENATSIDSFVLHYEGRLDAIGRTHVAAIRESELSLDMIVRQELLAQLIQDGPRATITGPDIMISIDEAEILGLAIHELAVNAVKFGAFADDDGVLTLFWLVEDHPNGRILRLSWKESNGPPIEFVEHSGFGRTVIERMLPFQLGASVDLRFEPSGVACDMAVPLSKSHPKELPIDTAVN